MRLEVIRANLVVNIKSFYREKAAMFFTIAFPIMLILLFGAIFSNVDDASMDLHVQDLDQTPASAELVKQLELNGTFIIHNVSAGETDIAQYANDNSLNFVLVVPRGYGAAVENRTMFLVNATLARMLGMDPNATTTFDIYYDPSSSTAQTKMQIINSVVGGMNQGMSGSSPVIHTSGQSVFPKKFRFIDFFLPGIIAMSVMTSSMFGSVSLNAELKQKGVIRKLSTTPITRAEWILSNMMYQMFLALISTVCIIFVGWALFQFELHLNAWLAVFVILDVLAFAGIGMLLTRFAKDADSAAAAVNVIMFPMMFLSGSFFSLEMMPGFLQSFARVLPLYYVNEGLRACMVTLDFGKVWFYAAVIGVFAMVMFVLGVFLTSWKED
jgi:ABC-2 type transport system permease protein